MCSTQRASLALVGTLAFTSQGLAQSAAPRPTAAPSAAATASLQRRNAEVERATNRRLLLQMFRAGESHSVWTGSTAGPWERGLADAEGVSSPTAAPPAHAGEGTLSPGVLGAMRRAPGTGTGQNIDAALRSLAPQSRCAPPGTVVLEVRSVRGGGVTPRDLMLELMRHECEIARCVVGLRLAERTALDARVTFTPRSAGPAARQPQITADDASPALLGCVGRALVQMELPASMGAPQAELTLRLTPPPAPAPAPSPPPLRP